MSDDGKKRPGSRPSREAPLSRDDWALWEKVKQSATPIHKPSPASVAFRQADPVQPLEARPPEAKSKARKPAPGAQKQRAAVNPQKLEHPPAKPGAPTLNSLDRRTVQRIARGATDIDGRIDLHGMTQRNAHAQLWRFLTASQARGHKVVLVITGKGSAKTSEYGDFREVGILRRAVPLWLQEPGFRALVVGYQQARRHHGGDGALYIRLRRRTVDGMR